MFFLKKLFQQWFILYSNDGLQLYLVCSDLVKHWSGLYCRDTVIFIPSAHIIWPPSFSLAVNLKELSVLASCFTLSDHSFIRFSGESDFKWLLASQQHLFSQAGVWVKERWGGGAQESWDDVTHTGRRVTSANKLLKCFDLANSTICLQPH